MSCREAKLLDGRVGATVHIYDKATMMCSLEMDLRAWSVGDETVCLMVDARTGKPRPGVPPFRVLSSGQRFHSLAEALRALAGALR